MEASMQVTGSVRPVRGMRRRRVLGITAAAGALMAACGSTKRFGSGRYADAGSSAQARQGGVLTIAAQNDLVDLDASLTTAGGWTRGLTCDSLLRVQQGANVAYDDTTLGPSLAERWEVPEPNTY